MGNFWLLSSYCVATPFLKLMMVTSAVRCLHSCSNGAASCIVLMTTVSKLSQASLVSSFYTFCGKLESWKAADYFFIYIHVLAFRFLYMLEGIVQFRQLCNCLGNSTMGRQLCNSLGNCAIPYAIVQFPRQLCNSLGNCAIP
jgi:hypothetical protein